MVDTLMTGLAYVREFSLSWGLQDPVRLWSVWSWSFGLTFLELCSESFEVLLVGMVWFRLETSVN